MTMQSMSTAPMRSATTKATKVSPGKTGQIASAKSMGKAPTTPGMGEKHFTDGTNPNTVAGTGSIAGSAAAPKQPGKGVAGFTSTGVHSGKV